MMPRLLALMVLLFMTFNTLNAADYRVYFGTYTGDESKGIYTGVLHESGELKDVKLAAEAVNPTFLAIHPNGKILYAVSEVGEFNGKKDGGVAAYSIDPKSGMLKELNRQVSGGTGPCHLIVDQAGKTVLVANYGGGSISSIALNDDGTLGDPVSQIKHEGKSVNPQRQEAPHAHSINLDPAGNFAFAADLGLDQVLIYQFDPKTGKMTPNDPPFAELDPGAGPRHFSFHPSGKYAYVINEMTCTVTGFEYDAKKGALKTLQTISTIPFDKVPEGFSTAEVVVHPSGKALYGSNRGHHTIAIFKLDPKTGELSERTIWKAGGETPRNFALAPEGKLMVICHQDSGSVKVVKIDDKTGMPIEDVGITKVPRPVCARFLKLK